MGKPFIWVDESKGERWSHPIQPDNVEKVLSVGCLMRIANALETIVRRTPKTAEEIEEERKKEAKRQEHEVWCRKFLAQLSAEQPIRDAWKEKASELPLGVLAHVRQKQYDVLGPTAWDDMPTQKQLDERIKQIRAVDWRSPEVAAKIFKKHGSQAHRAYLEWLSKP